LIKTEYGETTLHGDERELFADMGAVIYSVAEVMGMSVAELLIMFLQANIEYDMEHGVNSLKLNIDPSDLDGEEFQKAIQEAVLKVTGGEGVSS